MSRAVSMLVASCFIQRVVGCADRAWHRHHHFAGPRPTPCMWAQRSEGGVLVVGLLAGRLGHDARWASGRSVPISRGLLGAGCWASLGLRPLTMLCAHRMSPGHDSRGSPGARILW